VQRGVAHVEEIGTEREMGSVFLENAEWEYTHFLGTVNAFAEIRGRKFFPVDGEFRLRRGGLSVEKSRCVKSEG
jgi:hypothetical protein